MHVGALLLVRGALETLAVDRTASAKVSSSTAAAAGKSG